MPHTQEDHMEQGSLHIGEINGHTVGIVLKEAIRRAVQTIRNYRFAHEVLEKGIKDDGKVDVFTQADIEAQRIYVGMIKENFPNVAIIGEEEGLRYTPEGWDGRTYVTIDPLDGTKAFTRLQSHGVGSMIAMVQDGVIISAFIADVNTQEIYGYRPGSNKVHRISEYETSTQMGYTRPFNLDRDGNNYILLRDPLPLDSTLTVFVEQNFGSYKVDGGSIGIWLMQLMKREVAAALLPPSKETPWDSTPILGIAQKLGYHFLEYCGDFVWRPFDVFPPTEIYEREHPLLIVHEHDVPSLGMITLSS